MKMIALRYADLAAYQPCGIGRDLSLQACLARRDLECGKQDGFVLIAVVGQRPVPELFRTRPLYLAHGKSIRELPFQGGWLAGVAGVLPVDVPSRIKREMHRQP